MKAHQQAFEIAANVCIAYSNALARDKFDWAIVALECAELIEDVGKGALTIAEIGNGSCQELSSFLIVPEIDYTSGLPRK